jgi:hypothetical protein
MVRFTDAITNILLYNLKLKIQEFDYKQNIMPFNKVCGNGFGMWHS